MVTKMKRPNRFEFVTVAAVAIVGCAHGTVTVQPVVEPTTVSDSSLELAADVGSEQTTAVLVQGSDTAALAAAVRAVGGEITHELGIINAVGALLSEAQVRQLKANNSTLRIQANSTVGISGGQITRLMSTEPVKSPSILDAPTESTSLTLAELSDTTVDVTRVVASEPDDDTETMSINIWVDQQ